MNTKGYVIGGWLAILLALSCWLASFYWLYLQGGKSFHEIGPLGDWIAGITAPFLNVAGFFMIYAAFRRQGTDADQARKEFHLQRFETTFFHLVQQHHQHVQMIQQNYARKSPEDFFEAAVQFLKRRLGEEADMSRLQAVYQEYHLQAYNYIDHFVRHLLFTLDFVLESTAFDSLENGEAERKRYLGMLRAQLSTEELLLLFYHTLCDPSGYTASSQANLVRTRFFGRLQQSDQLLLHPSHWQQYEAAAHVSSS